VNKNKEKKNNHFFNTIFFRLFVLGISCDLNGIRIGACTNIQDRVVILTAKDNPYGLPASVQIGEYVTVGECFHFIYFFRTIGVGGIDLLFGLEKYWEFLILF
jgi:hypothetical protein